MQLHGSVYIFFQNHMGKANFWILRHLLQMMNLKPGHFHLVMSNEALALEQLE
jgi:hypothetical protein